MSDRKRFGKTTHLLESCESTNDVAMDLARSGCADGAIVIAKNQTRGKGRHGRVWESWPGNLALSVVVRPHLSINESYRLVLNSALAVATALQKLDVNAFIKWPNDILIMGDEPIFVDKLGPFRKVGGILLEVISTNQQIDAAVIGFGLNLFRPLADQESRVIPQMGFVQDARADVSLPPLLDSLLDQLELHLSNPNQEEILRQVKKF